MKDMQKLQPKVAKIREKYKDDKEAMNKELMGLYRTFKVNPMAGCLPMVLQLPVFIALYNVLGQAIELRHAAFIPTLPFTNIVWLADLSAKILADHPLGHGGHHVHPAEDDSFRRRPGSGQDDDVFAPDLYFSLSEFRLGSGGLLAGQQCSFHCAAALY